MKRQQAMRAAAIIRLELRKLGRIYGSSLHPRGVWDCEPIIEVKESPNSKGWWGVEIRTDGDSYEAFYEIFPPWVAEKNHLKVQAVLDKKLGFKKGEHYFESAGGGILDYY